MPTNESTSAKVAEYLLEIKATKLQPHQPFTWASGWKSPIYNDNRISLSYPKVRNFIKGALAELIHTHYPGCELIAGVATAGIAPGALAADALELPFGYVRSEAKKHGMGNRIEGAVLPGQKVVVVEDLISTGKSSLEAVEALKAYGCEVLGLAAIFTYGFDIAVQQFAQANCPFVTLSNYDELIRVAIDKNYVQQEDLALLADWRKNPAEWGK
ncbi:MAG: orotate phosphoribosyltransferase [Bacteroidia bacterium]|nr:orotate phosphoribosyltransferase [Bacteroidia bacterium]MBP7260747.1 orotate phosphoribosyltransferase [Bacteroidia bacterium]MBP9179906.1 orotate phosphoribosyltransferase [Bacteroidia bacterium]MBP9724181.1 orotate phosphoribosyltransferase [Bacteroidia bacterium]